MIQYSVAIVPPHANTQLLIANIGLLSVVKRVPALQQMLCHVHNRNSGSHSNLCCGQLTMCIGLSSVIQSRNGMHLMCDTLSISTSSKRTVCSLIERRRREGNTKKQTMWSDTPMMTIRAGDRMSPSVPLADLEKLDKNSAIA